LSTNFLASVARFHAYHRDAETKLKLGIRETLVRISVGIEDAEDLWEDLEGGLAPG